MRLRRQPLPGVGDLALSYRSQLTGSESKYGCGFALESQELDLKGFALAVYMHDHSDVASLQRVLWNVLRENDLIVFANHDVSLIGWAVISRGARFPCSTIQTVLMSGVRPEGVAIGPSTL